MPFTRDQLDDITKIITTTVEKLLEDQKFILSIAEAVSNSVLQQLNEKTVEQDKKIQELESEVDNLKVANLKYTCEIDNLEQYGRRNSIRIFGSTETQNENISEVVLDILNSKLKTNIKVEDIDRMHRIGKPTMGGTRAIIVKFTSYRCRKIVFDQKKLLKGSRIAIREDLTAERNKLLKAAAKKYTFKNVWSRDGKILIRTNNTVKLITSIADL